MNSPVVTSAQMKAAEGAAFAKGVTADALMERAGWVIARSVTSFFSQPGECHLFIGKGHNGGDALVAGRYLRLRGWRVETHLAFPEADCSPLTRQKLKSLRNAMDPTPELVGTGPFVVLDGLLGLGAKPPLRDPILSACREIRQLRDGRNAYVFAIDIPTGLDGDSGGADPDAVIADFTVTIGFVKQGLVADRALDFVGRLEVVPLPELIAPSEATEETVACASSLRGLLPRRKFGAYKNQFGRVGIVAGSEGLVGAALLCATAALRAGAGLVEVFVLHSIYEIVASAAPPEAMVTPVQTYRALPRERIAAWAIGPGLGESHRSEIAELIETAEQPMLVDADGLNILSHRIDVLDHCQGPRLLTPHAGEMKRLLPDEKESRAKTARFFCQKFPVTLLFKGSRTIVAEKGKPVSYNTTGNPGMATGGMGDALTGVCAAFMAQRLSPYDAGRLGAWVCGRAAEIAVFNRNESEQSLLPRDVIENLGAAFDDLQANALFNLEGDAPSSP